MPSPSPTRDRVLRELLSHSAAHGLEPGDPFYRVWRRVWAVGQAEEDPEAAMSLFRIAANDTDQAWRAVELVEDQLGRLADLDLAALLECLIHAEPLQSVADQALKELLTTEGEDAARLVVHIVGLPEDARPAVVQAARILLDAGAEDEDLMDALALSLHVDPDFAGPRLSERLNDLQTDIPRSQDFRYFIGEFDADVLIEYFGDDALERPEAWQELLAHRHWRLLEDAGAVIDWLEARNLDSSGRPYAGKLLAHALSDVTLETHEDLTERGIRLANELHDMYGDHDEEMLKGNRLNPDHEPEHRRLLAIEKADDVAHPSEEPDTASVLETLKDYEATLRALGGANNVERDLERGKIPLIAPYYEMDVLAELEEYYKLIERSGEPNMTALWLRRRIERTIAFRARWEQRFEKLHEHGFHPQKRRLWNDSTYWTELVFLSKLLDEFEVVDIEREDLELPGLGDRRPDFLLRSEDGDLILEVTSIQSSPEDVEKGVKGGLMLNAQNRLEKKLNRQLGGCPEGIEHPIVLAVETEYEPRMELPNSLYGPLSFRWAQDPSNGKTISEGTTRDEERAFFQRENVDCITAVVGVAPEDPAQPHLDGEIFDAAKPPRHPLNAALRVRLRRALFGPRPDRLVDQIHRLPSVSREEAGALVEHGIDNVSLLAAGRFSYRDGLPVEEDRFEELVNEARRMVTLERRGEIRFLAAAEDTDLEPFYEDDIYTIDQLQDAEARPEGVDEDTWAQMRAEAEQIR